RRSVCVRTNKSPFPRDRHPDGRLASARFLQRASRPEGPCGSSAPRFCTLYRKVPCSYSDAEESAPHDGARDDGMVAFGSLDLELASLLTIKTPGSVSSS